jgi:hypothetical protein
MQDVGRIFVVAGAFLLVGGGLLLFAARMGLPLGRLPGDVAFRGKHFAVYAPIATCLVLSLILSLLLWLRR